MPRARGKCRALLLGSPIGNCSKGLFLLRRAHALFAHAIFLVGLSARRRQHKGGGSPLRWRGTGPRPTEKGPIFYRSAGACPPRTFSRPQHGEGQALALRRRDPFFTVARGPVPCERWSAQTMARDRPSPYVKGRRFFTGRHRAHLCSSGAPAPERVKISVASERWRGTGPRPTEKRTVFYRSAGACPPRTLECANDGEGQALAPRRRDPFFIARPIYGEDFKSLRVI